MTDCAMRESAKSARIAAVRRVSSQENRPEPKTSRTICARKTMMNVIAGAVQKTMCRIEAHTSRTKPS